MRGQGCKGWVATAAAFLIDGPPWVHSCSLLRVVLLKLVLSMLQELPTALWCSVAQLGHRGHAAGSVQGGETASGGLAGML